MKESKYTAWIARDQNGGMWLYFNEKPRKDDIEWRIHNVDDMFALAPHLLPSVKWKDAEPTEVEITIKIKEMPNDKVLQALNDYYNQATEEQKKSDLDELEKECLSDVDAYQYVKDKVEIDNKEGRENE